MCGRFTITTKRDKLTDTFPKLIAKEWFGPRYNVAPSQPVPAILNSNPNELLWIRWGLVPHWAKDEGIGNKLINARAETLGEKPAFRRSFEKQRCLVLADGFYEWVAIPGSRLKKPYYIRMKSGEPFTFGGLWDKWCGSRGDLLSCTIITTPPNELVAPIHDRMPLILPPAARDRWLNDATPPRDLLVPYASIEMLAFPVSTSVNSVATDHERCIEPASENRELF